MVYDTNTTRREANARPETTVSTGIPFWDLMFSFGKASQQALSGFAPRAEYNAPRADYSTRPDYGTRSDRGAAQQTARTVEVIPVGEETLNVGTRLVAGDTTRVRRVVVETPVEQGVSLREERVVVERRKPTGAASTATQAILTDTAIEMSDSFEVVEVWKSVRVTEEVVLRREVTERHETVRDSVRRDEVVVEQAKHSSPALRHEAETVQHDRKAVAAPQANKPEPAQIAADLKKVAERFETNAGQHDQAPATSRSENGAAKADHKPVASQPQAQPPKATAEQPKTPVVSGRPEASAAQNDKGSNSPKN